MKVFFPPLKTISVDGRQVSYHYHRHPTSDNTPVLLLHGGGIDRASLSWRYLVPELANHVSIIAPDWPGHGQSGALGGTFTLDDLGQWLVRFLDEVDFDLVDVVGVSMGGGGALWLALNQMSRIRKIIPVDSYALQATSPPSQLLAYLITRTPTTWLSQSLLRHNRWMMRYALTQIFADKTRITDELVLESLEVVRECDGLKTFSEFQRGEVTPRKLRGCLMQELHNISAPTLLIHGQYDSLVPLHYAEEAAGNISNATLLTLDAGHWPMREQPEAFNKAVIDFLV